MKTKLNNLMVKYSGLLASLAMVLAVASTKDTCFFLTHQPDVPESLKDLNG